MLQPFLLYAGLFLAAGLLARFWPCNPGQPRFVSRELPTDLIYLLTLVLWSGTLTAALVLGVCRLVWGPDALAAREALYAGHGALARLPLWVQIPLILVISDIIQYWLHRGFHGRRLWDFHAVHHSSHDLDWITTFRVHPLNYVAYTTSVGALIVLAGFSPVALAILAPINGVHAALVHANLNLTFGPFRYVLASPVFHRWHHVDDPNVRDKNFAPTFPVLDLMFGTFHMPAGELPQVYGAHGVPPTGYLRQLAYPFRALLAPRPEVEPVAEG
jgi:sterol desaturase/sphingolipid hydroxylase (fatty acid hydroxylase superfamily)